MLGSLSYYRYRTCDGSVKANSTRDIKVNDDIRDAATLAVRHCHSDSDIECVGTSKTYIMQ